MGKEGNMKTGGLSDLVGKKFNVTFTSLGSYLNNMKFSERDFHRFKGELVSVDTKNWMMYFESDKGFKIIYRETIAEMIEILEIK
jgi:hypothetical protein